MQSVKNLPAVFAAIPDAGVPDRFTHSFLKQLGFTSSQDRGVIAVMKAMRFLDESGVPTDRYKRYRDPTLAGVVMADALRDAYSDLFKINESAQTMTSPALKGAFKRISGKGDSVAEKMAMTFKALAKLADWSKESAAATAQTGSSPEPEPEPSETTPVVDKTTPPDPEKKGFEGGFAATLRHDVHVHLPATTDVKVYDAIFRSLKEHIG